MVKSTLPFFAAATTLWMGASAANLDPVVIKGSKFFYKTNGTQFYIKGVAYQQGQGKNGATASSTTKYIDPLSDATLCARDIPKLAALGVNTIRTYSIDPTANHKACMDALNNAGIYVISDLGEPNLSIDRSSPQWNLELYQRYTQVIDSMAPYTNVIGFFAGNEVPNNLSYTASAAYVKAAVRDSKAYIASKKYTQGVGYAADDDQTVRAQVAAYMNCGDAGSAIDFWGYNIYEWCGNSNYELSGYDKRVKEFATYSVPTFFAEYGCNTGGGGIPSGAAARTFSEVDAIYGTNMTPVFSGGIVFQYFQEVNDFGLVSALNPSAVSTLADYTALSTQLNAAKPTAVQSGSYNPSNSALACPPVASNWAAASVLPPTPDANVCECMMASLSCTAKAGLDGASISSIFGTICAPNFGGGQACKNIVGNATSGIYGQYSMCNATQRLANAFDTYYNSLDAQNKATGCDFGGNATTTKPAAVASCGAVLSSASASASAAATAAGAAPDGGSAASTTKKSEGQPIMGASLGLGIYFTVGFSLLAGFSGLGMILL
ncbi:Glucanosyltransferase-domain-containing protein [Amylocarpus encephaloides]|uniref:1,3-beta-glucanosyltransferase n=1 Tax=Amylocarpus encephaloides TaxID=45428 RepID=A0A9P7Y8D3_9HELO|nr:Glucanosyltransferase-domain-containing protein [Amylocarpus encephaloides]